MAGWNTTDIDWTSAETIRPTLEEKPYLVLYDIGEAIRERSGGCARPLLSSVRRGDTKGRVIELNAELDACIPLYANHVDSSGNWDNKSSIPYWSTSSLDSAIGVSRPSDPTNGSILSSEWAFWAYSAINLMLWYRKGSAGFMLVNEYKSSVSSNWATAVSNFNAITTWTTFIPRGLAEHRVYYSSGDYVIGRSRTYNTEIVPPAQAPAYYKLDIYEKFKADFFPSARVYENNDYAVDEDNFGRVFSDTSERIGNIAEGSVYVGNFQNNTQTQPTTETLSWVTDTADSVGVFKYDVSGGFDYVAP